MIRGALILLLFLGGCNYRIGADGFYRYRSVKLSIFDSLPERRTHEFDLTQAVSKELLDNGIRVNSPNATHEVVGEIEKFEEPVSVVDAQDIPIVGSVSIQLRVRVIDLSSGEIVREKVKVERATFTNARGETREGARRQVFDRLARFVASTLETDW